MKTLVFKNCKALLIWIMLMLCVNVWSFSISFLNVLEEDGEVVKEEGSWENKERTSQESFIYITQYSQHLTIQDSNPVNTITVKITSNETGATVFENVYPQGQTSFIVIPINGWSAGSYTIELFGRENNGYLWGTFQVLP